MSRKRFSWLLLLLWIIAVEFIGILSSLFAGNIKAMYEGLNLPVLSPPSYVFGPVWTVLYALIGIAGYLLVYHSTSPKELRTNLFLFFGQLFLNFIWSIVFFGGSNYWVGVAIIIALVAVVFACINVFHKTSTLASYLLVPYVIWITFATYLTLGVAILN
ncbi:TspO/MBR family protein [Furfurilactobacillus sp. WILCCON 0119]